MHTCYRCGAQLYYDNVDGICCACRYKQEANADVVPMGWQCPRCGLVNAPWVPICSCPPDVTITQHPDTSTKGLTK